MQFSRNQLNYSRIFLKIKMKHQFNLLFVFLKQMDDDLIQICMNILNGLNTQY